MAVGTTIRKSQVLGWRHEKQPTPAPQYTTRKPGSGGRGVVKQSKGLGTKVVR